MFNLFKKEDEEHNYFRDFEAISSQIVKVSELLLVYLNKDSFASLEEALEKSKTIEKIANEQRNELLNYLYEDFLPPIERQDIIRLTYSLDAVLKNTVDIMLHLDMYQITVVQPEMRKLMEIIGKATHEIPQMMKDLEGFKHPQKIREAIEEMHEINRQGTEIYRQGVKHLNLGEMNSFETMKYTRMYECLNDVLNTIEELTNSVIAMIIQNT